MKMYEARYNEALRLIPERADELDQLNSKAKTMFGDCTVVVQAVASADTPEETAKSVELVKSNALPWPIACWKSRQGFSTTSWLTQARPRRTSLRKLDQA
jgi:hypothetical protein